MKHPLNQFNGLLYVIIILICSNCIDKRDLIASYERDKFVAADNSVETKNKIEHSGSWIISLKDNDIFEFRGTNKLISGTWAVEREEGDDYYIKFLFDDKSVNGKLNGSIIYFEGSNVLFDKVFERVIFVRTTRTIK